MGITEVDPLHITLRDSVCFDDVTLYRGDHTIFETLSLNWSERRVGLIGNNGSGKSSFVRLLNRLVVQEQGQISVFGYDTAKQPEVLPSLIGFIFQNPDHQLIFPTVLEELVFGCTQLGLPSATAEEKARLLLAEHNISDWENRPVSQLSEGQKQLICILSVLIMQPKLIVLDEPFSSLDLPTRHKLISLLFSLDAHILMISHDFSVYEQFDRLIWLDQGKIAADGKPDEVIKQYTASVELLAHG